MRKLAAAHLAQQQVGRGGRIQEVGDEEVAAAGRAGHFAPARRVQLHRLVRRAGHLAAPANALFQVHKKNW